MSEKKKTVINLCGSSKPVVSIHTFNFSNLHTVKIYTKHQKKCYIRTLKEKYNLPSNQNLNNNNNNTSNDNITKKVLYILYRMTSRRFRDSSEKWGKDSVLLMSAIIKLSLDHKLKEKWTTSDHAINRCGSFSYHKFHIF